MYILAPWKKADPVVRWNLPDRVFFGHGACHILAGVFWRDTVRDGFTPYWIVPKAHPGAHVFVSNGSIAFDYHGYSVQERLLDHHWKVWRSQHRGWDADVLPVSFDLLDTAQLNERNMRGADQYQGDPIVRARSFLARIDHARAVGRAEALG